MILTLLKLGFRNLLYSKKRSALALLSIVSGFVALSLFQGYINDAENIFQDSYKKRSMFADLIIESANRGSMLETEESTSLDLKTQEFLSDYISKNPKAKLYSRFLRLNGSITNGRTNAVIAGYGYDIGGGTKIREPAWGWNTMAGRPLNSETENSIVIGAGLGRLLDCEITTKEKFMSGQGGYKAEERPFECRVNPMQVSFSTIHGQLNAMDVQVVGIVDAMFREVDLKYFAMPLQLAQKLMDTNVVSFYTVELQDPSLAHSFSDELESAAKTAGFAVKSTSWKEHKIGDFYRKSMDFLGIFQKFIMVVIIFVTVLSVFNTFMRIVQERIREIGTLRSIGFKNVHVVALFIFEALLLSFVGCLVGMLITALFATFISSLLIPYKVGQLTQPVPFIVETPVKSFFSFTLLLFAIAILATLNPAISAVRKKISDCFG